MIQLTAIDLNSHRIETWGVSIPDSNILYLEDVSHHGSTYTRVHLMSGKTLVVTQSRQRIEALQKAEYMIGDDRPEEQ